ncbi:MAG: dTDP-4-dehydrorhamnose 3,5-epimerase [Magnetococcales bacterium]|nr:dTDP-4-dehydrorhamnose 3,5-epimerase [Magnetococcales bacterium]
MKTIPTAIPDIILIEPDVFCDERGYFYESWNQRSLKKLGIDVSFVQDNHSKSVKNVLRGLHYQIMRPQGKLVRVIAGEVFDVAVDLRRSSHTFGKCVGLTLSVVNKYMVWIPPGFAHGFCVTSESAELLYKTTEYWFPEFERILKWNDPCLNIDWPQGELMELAEKDANGIPFEKCDTYD